MVTAGTHKGKFGGHDGREATLHGRRVCFCETRHSLAKPKLVILGGMIAIAPMGDPNASISTPQPVHYRPMYGLYGRALASTGVTLSRPARRGRSRRSAKRCACDDIDLSFAELEALVSNSRPDWKAALESIKGIYLITDTRTGKRYVGS
ncbi:hypothetical protein DPM13_01420 [Paracoccus mutanolyticus]|uniref:Urease domain-containing protein n=1 Tax=Paracoccus mutanolyticus TaxID=1499308 RepID=A0ABM6WP13_9RHOB|nr:hypothetical protein [Paracoccus mutanolyticus]AWX92359.1 hypothetical protein DPM13_01420 [Paracoccus mutanolyticus]